MSFPEILKETLNASINIQVNDLLLIIIASFFLGRWYEQRIVRKSFYYANQRVPSRTLAYPLSARSSSWAIMTSEGESRDEGHQSSMQRDGRSEDPHVRQQNQDEGQAEEQEELKTETEMLLQKIRIDGQKIQERGTFEMYFEKNSKNLRLIRKIEKHEIISDYLLRESTGSSLEIVPVSGRQLSTQPILPDENSRLEVHYYHNYENIRNSKPVIEQRVVSLRDNPQVFHPSFEHGRFWRLFREPHPIGRGGFGTVIEALNIYERKKYAIKKIYVRNTEKQGIQDASCDLERIFNEVKILSHISHLNIVQYYNSWMEYSALSECEGLAEVSSPTKKKSRPLQSSHSEGRADEVSYYSNEHDEDVAFGEPSALSLHPERQKSRRADSSSFSRGDKVVMKESRSRKLIRAGSMDINEARGFVPVIYIQMELCKHSLAEYMRRRSIPDSTFAFRIMKQVFEGVQFLHSKGIVHRDLKPDNIFIDAQGNAKIGDFGLSASVERLGDISSKWLRAGTPCYIAPELTDFHRSSQQKVDFYLADVFALGVIYYELLVKFNTVHERGEKMQKLRQGEVPGLQGLIYEKKLIRELVRTKNRPQVHEILASSYLTEIEESLTRSRA